MKVLSVCSGIGADAVAWHKLGWTTAAFAEIEPHAATVLRHHYPNVPNHGDFTTIKGHEYGSIDLIVGGTPCQSFSIAGLRKGMDDNRGNLALQFIRLVDRIRPRWVVWENVPGVFSAITNDTTDPNRSTETHAFACILAGFQKFGYGFAYRTLDAQFVRVESHPRAVPQRRRRVFLVGHIGDWRPPTAVLFEPKGLRRNPAPRRKPRQEVAGTFSARPSGGGGLGTDFKCAGGLVTREVAPALDAHGSGYSDFQTNGGLIGYGVRTDGPRDVSTSLNAHGQRLDFDTETFVMQERLETPNPDSGPNGKGWRGDGVAFTIEARSKPQSVATSTVRRITPTEAERLMGLPDNYTLVPYKGKPMADGPRYKLLGNSIAINCLSWIGQRIAMFESLDTFSEA